MSVEEEFVSLPRWQRERAYQALKAKRKLEGSTKSINVLELMAVHKSIKVV
jgi:hypothetical protein